MSRHSSRTKKHRSTDNTTTTFETISKRALIGGAVSLAVMIVFALIGAALCMLNADPAGLTLPIGLVTFYISAAAGGYASAVGMKKQRASALTSAALCGFIIAILTGICAALQEYLSPHISHNIPTVTSILLRFLAIPVSMLFSYFALIEKRRRSRRRR